MTIDTEREMLRDALAAVDAAREDCPVLARWTGGRCPKCGAGRRDSCGPVDAAKHEAVEAARKVIATPPAPSGDARDLIERLRCIPAMTLTGDGHVAALHGAAGTHPVAIEAIEWIEAALTRSQHPPASGDDELVEWMALAIALADNSNARDWNYWAYPEAAKSKYGKLARAALTALPAQRLRSLPTVRPLREGEEELVEYVSAQCNRYTNGQCTTLRCLRRGGWNGTVPPDFSIATCEEHEIAQRLRSTPPQGQETSLRALVREAYLEGACDGRNYFESSTARKRLEAFLSAPFSLSIAPEGEGK